MSAMTGPRSPTSPWPQESPSLQLAGPSTPAALFSLCDPQTSLNPSVNSQTTAAECSGPSYFSLSVDHLNHPRKSKDVLSRSQSTIPSPKSHLLSQRNAFENYMDHAGSGLGFGDRRDSPVYKLSVSRGLESKNQAVGPSNGPMALAALGNNHPVSLERCAELFGSPQNNMMFLDVRPYTHYAKGHIQGSLNLCIPTTLLKRPSFNTQKLANTFTNDADKTQFAKWRNCDFIVVYDAATTDMRDAGPLANLLKKFAIEGWSGKGLVLCGGFDAFAHQFPTLVQKQHVSETGACSQGSNSTNDSLPVAAPIAGGCAMPDASHPSIPFFGNIRQHMDLLGGVGQIPVQLPAGLTQSMNHNLPAWLRRAADGRDKGLDVSEKFLDLEKKELERMKQALSYDKSANSTPTGTSRKFRIKDVPPGGCDYVNANFIQAEYSDKTYIATQAPVPDTFTDFWRVVWEQDVRLVVSLTSEVERGQVKCHPYWISGDYGPFQVNNFSQKYIYMDAPQMGQVDFGPNESSPESNDDFNRPCIIPGHLVQLIEQCNKIRDATATVMDDLYGMEPKVQRPVLRPSMVQNLSQFVLCYESVLEWITSQMAEENKLDQ
ncbi:hypothetical protein FE257_002165 [Aspergillus nanangensis]|uniref:Uncharacterized protein n=1 Tax=Aspergillus nanangensis TaxID=2582783 RepID=A0AAD4CTY4_ASPNN|nr:hypothetical protein FE257_002165 [Aspergillus nanangensis]